MVSDNKYIKIKIQYRTGIVLCKVRDINMYVHSSLQLLLMLPTFWWCRQLVLGEVITACLQQ